MIPESSPPTEGPQYTPPGWIPLRAAFERLGEYQFTDAWTGKEFEALTTRGVEGQKRAFELRISELRQRIEKNKRTAERRARPQAVESGGPGSSPSAVVSVQGPRQRPDYNDSITAIQRGLETLPAPNDAACTRREHVWKTLRDLLYLDRISAMELSPLDGRPKAIEPNVWASSAAEILFRTGRTESTGDRGWIILRQDTLESILSGANGLKDDNTGPKITPARRRGRRPQYDWALFHAEIARMVGNDPDGFPVIQADLESTMTDWCVATWGENKCPSESTIRSQVNIYYSDDSQGQ